jgi:hypothetical protein
MRRETSLIGVKEETEDTCDAETEKKNYMFVNEERKKGITYFGEVYTQQEAVPSYYLVPLLQIYFPYT